MTTIDLTTPPAPAAGLLDGLPRRVALTLVELRRAAELAGGAPLPFDEREEAGGAGSMAGRLGATGRTGEDSAYRQALASLHDADPSLSQRGLVTDGALDPALAGALGLLATPELALEIDVTIEGGRAKAWHRVGNGMVATLGTVDGVVFELAWFPASQWHDDLARVASLPEDVQLRVSSVPAQIELPYELADAAAEASRQNRTDLVPLIAAQHSGAVEVDQQRVTDTEAMEALAAITSETRGRIRVLSSAVNAEAQSAVGVVSWVLVADGWRSLRTLPGEGGPRLRVEQVDPTDLGHELAPVLTEVIA